MTLPIDTGGNAAAAVKAVAVTDRAPSQANAGPWEDARAFLERVLPWPGPDDPGYVGIFRRNVQKRKEGMWGSPVRSVDKAIEAVGHIQQDDPNADIYFCTALLRHTKPSRSGKTEMADRGSKNRSTADTVVSHKTLFLDIDVKPGEPNKYQTTLEAYEAVSEFYRAVNLPVPSIMVESGSGGIHVYWVFKNPLPTERWEVLAEALENATGQWGLLRDAGLTTDSVRVLRVPETINHKTAPGKPVVLRFNKGPDYDEAAIEKALAPYRKALVALAAVGDESLAEGIRTTHWFEALSPQLKDEVVDHALGIIAKNTQLLELESDGGKNAEYYKLTVSVARSGAPNAEDIFVKHASSAKNADTDKALRRDFLRCSESQPSGREITIGTLLHVAQQHGANFDQWKQVASDVAFRDLYKSGNPKPSLANAVIAIRALGIQARYDLFHHRINVTYNGQSNAIREGLLTDDTVSGTRSLINNTYEIDCGDANTLAAIKEIAQDNAYDPVLDLLNECQGKWDGVNRLDTWVICYLGCEDTPLNRAIGRKVLVAACRRAKVPGCKFDTITVLEGVEGTNKSTAIRLLAGDENFSDQSILGASDKEVQEQLDGIWMHENADLAGMRRAEIEHVKAFASRQVDRARPAYGRLREDRPRRSIEWGTTNNDEYLLSQTGNRRFWPLKTGKIDLGALMRDREQLLGEAATYEAGGESITLDPSLWDSAQQAQEQRRVADPWEDILANMPKTSDGFASIIHNCGDGFERVASADVLLQVLGIPKAQQTSAHGQRLARAMERVGWDRNRGGRVTINGVPVRGYIRRVHCPSLGQNKIATANQRIHAKLLLQSPWKHTVTVGIAPARQPLTG
jgi:hypothetical protein